ncbi:MAG: anthranilate phosphoribosyltransferase [Deltaproteobacteria bacterium]|nr:anthranilate phosphoribosyltransferase [Deltaproteobacteria bacterium]
MFKQLLQEIISGNDLPAEQMASLVGRILDGEATDAQIGAFMGALAAKGESFEELTGAAQEMRRKAKRIQASSPEVVDTCGTGGDSANTFNISTTAAFVVAGCGITVAKHGNRSVSSQCGSADLLEALGMNLDVHPEIVEEAVNEIGIGFLFAPLYHSALRFAARARKEVGVRSIFNMLGPLTNPAAANCQVLGVYAPELTEVFAQTLGSMGAKRAFVVHGHDGLDEISVCAPTRISELDAGQVKTYDIAPERYFGEAAGDEEIRGGRPEENALITRSLLEKRAQGPKRNIVLINAAAAIVAAGRAATLKEGIRAAGEAIDSGAAADKLHALVKFTNQNG